jgi:hypothetical protein
MSSSLRVRQQISYTIGIMVITYHGGQFFKVSFGDTTLAFDPIAKQSKLPGTKFGADIAFVSLNHPNFNGVEQVTHASKTPFVVAGPGEYEFGSVTARGYGVKTMYEGVDRFNTIYQVRLEEINMVFLGALSTSEIDPKILAELGDIDILFVPVGGGDVLDVPEASKLAVKLEAKLIIPMHYDAAAITTFLKEVGAGSEVKVDKLTLKKKDILEMQGEIRVLSV